MAVLLLANRQEEIDLARTVFQSARQVVAVRDCAEALNFLENRAQPPRVPNPRLVILDLPEADEAPLALLAYIKAQPDLRRIPVVILSGSPEHLDLTDSYNHYAACYIAKPAGEGELAEVFRHLEEFWFKTVNLPPAKV